MATTPAGGLLARQLKQMQGDKDIPGISCGVADGNIFEWEVMLMIATAPDGFRPKHRTRVILL